jgi:hypothetical protein
MLLQFIWQYSLYNPVGLCTTMGDPITIVHPGQRNHHAGPDFSEGRIRIGKTTLVGNIEIHLKTGDWMKHGHQHDLAYSNIVLHVVYEDDLPEHLPMVPKVQLRDHIPAYVISQYTSLLQTSNPIACASQLGNVKELTKISWLSRLLAERWEGKLGEWKELLDHTAGDWRKLLYWRMAANFGFKVNSTPFLLLARSLPINILARHKDDLQQIEALLFGQAGLLPNGLKDPYALALRGEYRHLQRKYRLEPLKPHLWKFLRLRPANFPTIRIAQFAMLVHKSLHLFSRIAETQDTKYLYHLLEVKASDYWSTHYRFDELQEETAEKQLGESSIRNIIINTVAPIQFLYANYNGDIWGQEKALQLLGSIPGESNKLVTEWNKCGWKPENAAESQGLIQLFNNYCSSKRCLECAIGLSIIKSGPDK